MSKPDNHVDEVDGFLLELIGDHHRHLCLTCDGAENGCINCRNTGYNQTPCLICDKDGIAFRKRRETLDKISQYYADFYRNKIPKKIEDDEGWDMAFEQSRGEVIECCPGDDMAYGFNKAVDLITAQFNSKEENV